MQLKSTSRWWSQSLHCSPEDDKVAVANHYMSAAEWLLHEHYQETTGDEDAPF